MSKTELCRLCANLADHANSQNLFKRNQRRLLQQVEELTGLQLKNTKDLPQFICEKCQEQTTQSHDFREQCIQAQQHFATIDYGNQIKAPPIEEVVLHEIKPIKEEEDEVEEKSEVLLASTMPSIVNDNSNSESFNPLAEVDDDDDDEHNSSEAMMAVEPEISLAEDNDENDRKPPLKNDKKNICKKSTVKNDNKIELKARKRTQKPGEATKKPKRMRKKSVYPQKKDFICELCGNCFSLKTNLEIHMLRHAGNRPFQCELCPGRYYTKAILARHMLSHTGEKPYPCRFCDSRFMDSISRVRHERNHTNERPYACNDCGKSFTQAIFLKNHMLTHTGVRAFDCKLCNAQFKRKTHLVTHFRSLMHKQNEEKHQLLDSKASTEPPSKCDTSLQ